MPPDHGCAVLHAGSRMQLSLEQVGKTVGPAVHLYPQSLSLVSGAVTVLLGATQGGKTSLMRVMAGLDVASTGRVLVDGVDVTRMSVRQRNVAMVYQQFVNYPSMTVAQNIAVGLRNAPYTTREKAELVAEHVALVGLEGFERSWPHQISGGMARRVALARAVALDPQLVMYDEPFAGLDPISMGVTANLIRTLNDALGSTSVLVSHDVHESFLIADYVYFLSQGRIVAHGTPAQMTASSDPYVKQFVHAEADGPVPFHYPGRSLAEQLGDLGAAARTFMALITGSVSLLRRFRL
eukprot:gene41980-55705_t